MPGVTDYIPINMDGPVHKKLAIGIVTIILTAVIWATTSNILNYYISELEHHHKILVNVIFFTIAFGLLIYFKDYFTGES
jgi:hypothetical protein